MQIADFDGFGHVCSCAFGPGTPDGDGGIPLRVCVDTVPGICYDAFIWHESERDGKSEGMDMERARICCPKCGSADLEIQ